MAGKHDVARAPRNPAPGGALGDALAAAGSVYGAAMDPARWPEALAIVAETLGTAAAVLVLGTPGREPAVVAATSGLEPGAALACAAVDAARDPLLKAAGRRSGRPVASGAEVGERALAASELGRLVLAPCGLRHALAIALAPGSTGFAAVLCFRAAGPPFGTAERELLAAWAPHLRRALEIQQGLAEAASRSAASEQLLDRLTLGAIVVDEEARPVMTNRLAERLLAAGDGLCSNPSGLTGSTPAATARLRAAVRETVREAAASGRVRSAGLRLERTLNPRPYEVIVVSLRCPAHRSGPRAAAIVFVADPERTQVTPERLLRDLYALTPAESRLAMALARGRTLTETASALGIARNTAHSQLASIFSKTGTGTQAELVRLLHRGPSAIRAYEDSAEYRPVPTG